MHDHRTAHRTAHRTNAQVLRRLRKERVAVPHWFSVCTRSGELEIVLEPDGAFAAEVYVSDLGLEEVRPGRAVAVVVCARLRVMAAAGAVAAAGGVAGPWGW